MPALNGAIDAEKVYSVSEITSRIKNLIETEYPDVWVVGEVSNCTAHSSGHYYFTLKDQGAQLRCVLFSGNARRLSVRPEDGLKLYAQGRFTVYEKHGQYELIVSTIMPSGRGDLYLAFNKLKESLSKEGLFDADRKKVLPRFPARLALITSPTGAAVRDVIRVATKIHRGIEIVVFPVRVQGEAAKDEIVSAIEQVSRAGGFDVIVLARGGGSIEDLWAFNEEIVARAISASDIPLVSAVGHEIDFTIADFVADARAPTPSAAPPLVLAGYVDVKTRLSAFLQKAVAATSSRIERHTTFLAGLKSHYGLRRMNDRLVESMRDLDEAILGAQRSIESMTDAHDARLMNLRGKFEALSPLATLDRGYSICFDADSGAVVKRYDQVKAGDRLRIRFSEGGAVSTVDETGKEIG